MLGREVCAMAGDGSRLKKRPMSRRNETGGLGVEFVIAFCERQEDGASVESARQ